MSCGVAAAPPGTQPRALFVTADAALYGAKHRGVQLLLSSDLEDTPHEILRDRPRRPVPPGRRRWDDATDRPYAADAAAAVADAVQAMAEGMAETPADLAGALRWVGDTLLAPLDLDRWVLSSVRDPGAEGDAGSFVLDSLGLRRARLNADPAPVEEADIASETRPLDQFPAAAAAVRDGAVFGFELADGSADRPSEVVVQLLQRLGMRFVVGTGAHDGDRGWLLTVYGATDHVPLSAIREVMALARASAIREDASHE
jgi:hypothetical protein